LLTYACLFCSFFSYYRLERKKTTYECFEASYDSSENKLKKGFSLTIQFTWKRCFVFSVRHVEIVAHFQSHWAWYPVFTQWTWNNIEMWSIDQGVTMSTGSAWLLVHFLLLYERFARDWKTALAFPCDYRLDSSPSNSLQFSRPVPGVRLVS